MMTNKNNLSTLSQLREALDSKKINAVELTQEALNKAEALKKLNAFVYIDSDHALTQAKAADKLIAEGQQQALTGIPLAYKDVYATKSGPTTAASRMLQNYQSPFDASVVTKLNQAGTVNLGKLNCDEFSMGSANETSYFGPCLNPWDTTAVPGGSSGGSAAAVAAGIIPISTGTDTGGSIRQPAAHCGVSGIKPTYGTISRYGVIAYGSSLEQPGPFAHYAADLALVLDTMSGHDPKDPMSVNHYANIQNKPGRILQDFKEHQSQYASKTGLQGIKIGIPSEFFGAELDPQVNHEIQEALKVFESLGATLVELSLPLTRYTVASYFVLAAAEASSNLSRYDGIHFGHRPDEYEDLDDLIVKARTEGFGEGVRRRLMIGTLALSEQNYELYYKQAQKVRRLVAEDYKKALSKTCDFILGPVLPNVAKDLHSNQDTATSWLAHLYTLGVNLSGVPAASIPCGFAGPDNKRPVGLQIIGNYFNDGQLLALADRYQQETDWHLRTPEL